MVLADGDDGFSPTARWPQDQQPIPALTAAVEEALNSEAPAVSDGRAIALPLKMGDDVFGAAGLAFDPPPAQPTIQLRQLRWGLGWLAEAARGRMLANSQANFRRMSTIVDLVGSVLDARTYQGACLTAVNLLARETACVQVGIGFQRGRKRIAIAALSDVADFRMNTGHTRAIERAMFEATDQEGTVLHPRRPDQSFMVDRAHAELRKDSKVGEVLTVPMFGERVVIGALQFHKPSDRTFTLEDLMVAESAAAVLGPVLTEKRLLDRNAGTVLFSAIGRQFARLFGPRYIGRKIAVLVLAGMVAFLAMYESEFRVKANSEVQGRVIRSVTAPFDGNIAAQFARAGDRIRKGELLATLDDTDLRIEQLRARTDMSRFEGEYDRALADRKAPEARIAKASLAEAEARAELIAAQRARAELRAPFDAIVTDGDLSQSLGGAVRRGEELFKIAPLESFRIRVEVPETHLDEIEIGQTGNLVLASLPGESFPIRIIRITPQMKAQDGLNVALVEAEITEAAAQIRPGMRGVAKISIEQRLLIDIWMRPIVDWARLTLWRWLP